MDSSHETRSESGRSLQAILTESFQKIVKTREFTKDRPCMSLRIERDDYKIEPDEQYDWDDLPWSLSEFGSDLRFEEFLKLDKAVTESEIKAV